MKPTRVPHIFPLLSQYLSSNLSVPQPTTSSTSSAILMNENSQIIKHASYYLKEKAKNFSELKEMIKSESLPSGFVYVEDGSNIFYHYIKSSNQPLDSPKLLGTSIIKIFLQSLIAFSQHYKDHYRVLNLLSFLQICL